MPNQPLLLRSLVDLADSLVGDFDLVDLLGLLAERCVSAIDVTAAGVMLSAPSGALQVVASSSETMRTLELFQLQADEGPCIEAFRSGQAVVNVDLSAIGGRWPAFSAEAVGQGFRSAHSIPMRLRQRVLGALNLLRATDGPLVVADVDAAQALADIATIAIVQHQVVVDAQHLASQLSGALNSRITIEQAKGRISQATGVDMELAFRRLRAHARGHNLRLSLLADDIAQGRIRPDALDRLPPP